MIHHPQHQLNVRHSRPRLHYLKIHPRRFIQKILQSVQRDQFFQNILTTEGHFLLEEHFPNVGYLDFGFAYFPVGLAQKGDQRRSKRNQDKTR